MYLPESKQLPIGRLRSVFENTTNSYKYYWFLALLEEAVHSDNNEIPYSVLIRKMVSTVWYPLNYYRLSFGKADSFKKVSDFVSETITIDHSVGAKDVFDQMQSLNDGQNQHLSRLLDNLLRWVPYRFLRPFFAMELRGLPDGKVNARIIALANEASVEAPWKCPYSFTSTGILLHQPWKDYFREHIAILQSFIYWHLCRFVQKNNPNTIGVSEKLFKPQERSFGKQIQAWRQYLAIKPETRCIYSDTPLPPRFSLDHFIPWSYVVHDQCWNIVPASKSINSSKSDCLPDLNRYFDPFSRLQQDFLLTLHPKKAHKEVIEDYGILFGMEVTDILQLSYEDFSNRLRNTISPLVQNATNMGFKAGWVYNS